MLRNPGAIRTDQSRSPRPAPAAEFSPGEIRGKLALQYALRVPDLKAIEIGRGVFEQPAVPIYQQRRQV
jgi:hypothetical protein